MTTAEDMGKSHSVRIRQVRPTIRSFIHVHSCMCARQCPDLETNGRANQCATLMDHLVT